MPRGCRLKHFRVLVSTHRTDYLLTNEVEPRTTTAAEQESSVRWTIEQFHRELKQLTGVQAYQCRLARTTQSHCPGRAGLDPPQTSRLPDPKTVYQLKQGFLDAYMRHELIQPTVAFA